ncbi:MAG: hypothetical protein ABIU87_01870 [Ornithinibacter sp.]
MSLGRPTLALTGMLLLGACSMPSERPDASPAPTDLPLETSTVDPTAGSATPDPSPSPPVDVRVRPRVVAAIRDLASRESVAPEQAEVAAFTPVTWSDGSIGCPKPGMAYPQVQVEGELLILRVGARLFQYHSRGAGPFTHCADPTAGYTVDG